MARKQLPALPEALTANDSDLLLKRDVNGQIDQKLTIQRLREEAFGDLAAEDNAAGVPLSEEIDQAPGAEDVQQALAALGAFAGDGFQNIAVFDTVGVTSW